MSQSSTIDRQRTTPTTADSAPEVAARKRAQQAAERIEVTTPVCESCWVAVSLTGVCNVCGEQIDTGR